MTVTPKSSEEVAVTENVDTVSEPAAGTIEEPGRAKGQTTAVGQAPKSGTPQDAQSGNPKGSASRTRRRGGPRSRLGKERSRGNAVKHGLCAKDVSLLPGESRKEFDTWCQAFRDHYKPVGLPEELDVMELARLKWCLRRFPDAERAEIELERRYNSRAADRQKIDREEAQAIEAAVDAQASADMEIAQNTQVPVEIPRPGLMDRFDNPVIREKSLELLESLHKSIKLREFYPARDLQIIDKVFGIRTPCDMRIFYNSCAKPLGGLKDMALDQRIAMFLSFLDALIGKYKDVADRMDRDCIHRERLESKVAVVPERSTRYRARLERDYDRVLSRFLRQRQIRRDSQQRRRSK
jgi:hypothetical protein